MIQRIKLCMQETHRSLNAVLTTLPRCSSAIFGMVALHCGRRQGTKVTSHQASRVFFGKKFVRAPVSIKPQQTIYQNRSFQSKYRGLVPATKPLSEELTQGDWSQGLVPRTVHTKRFEEQVAGTCPKNSDCFEFVGQVGKDKVGPCD